MCYHKLLTNVLFLFYISTVVDYWLSHTVLRFYNVRNILIVFPNHGILHFIKHL